MKRIALISLTVIYLLSALGISVSSFYCCGKLESTSISFSTAKKQDCKMAAGLPGCCKTKTLSFKVKDQHVGSQALSLNANVFHAIIPVYIIADFSGYRFKPEYVAFNSHAPPDHAKAPVYILNCIYRI
ncbi:hypothetical protein [Mucilaginibacter sp. L3T2-6]|uniref:HYC_CC_PP family protein n=1 Tax=Mucilaginibacter sp. L3T2-6 TaxID=3062491 RepID=UPI00267542E0|nr:hypothetical protein [Mucilaginibacter sp. L3T2-6]MDO3641477.1 hypothetical protein [Mucilaginibacter sp. L3T2-6]MDV6213762.1 hypothetical protein [Mucilaginibacter sp. L3T2-6]